MEPLLSIVIPAYNESPRIGRTLERVARYLERSGRPGEIVVVDDGSSDDTPGILDAWRQRLGGRLRIFRLERNSGKGAAVRRGVEEATGTEILFSDADLSTPIEDVDRLYPALAGADIVIGSRALDGSNITVPQGRLRRLAGKTFNQIMRLLIGLPFRDTQCGFKLFRAPCAKELFASLSTDGFAFDVEILLRARRRGLRIAEVPVTWADSRDSRVRFFRDSLRMLLELIRIRLTCR